MPDTSTHSNPGFLYKNFYGVKKNSVLKKKIPNSSAVRVRFTFRDLTHIDYEGGRLQLPTSSSSALTPASLYPIQPSLSAEFEQKKTSHLAPSAFVEAAYPESLDFQSSGDISLESRNVQEKRVTPSKSGFGSLFREIFRFGLVSAVSFAVVLVVMNFSAYYQLSQYWIGKWQGRESIQARNIQNFVAQDNGTQPELLAINSPGGVPYLPKAGTPAALSSLNFRVTPDSNFIFIPKIGQNAPIVEAPKDNLIAQRWEDLEKDIQHALKNGVVHYPGTAAPGEKGNFFITGHSSYYFWEHSKYKDVFALLGELDVGDEFIVYYNQKRYRYRIFEKKIVPPSDTSVLQQDFGHSMATLMTCDPVGTDINRLIVKAELVEKNS